ncbi:hypothetical protein GQ457_09G008410 [Hibiscus cannabinus]
MKLRYGRRRRVQFFPVYIVLISLIAERDLHRLGKYLKHKKHDALLEALEKLRRTDAVRIHFPSINRLSRPSEETTHEEYPSQAINNRWHLFSTDSSSVRCSREGKAPLLSLEALHQLHIFIFVLAVVHVIFSEEQGFVNIKVLYFMQIRQWKQWEDWIKHRNAENTDQHDTFVIQHAQGYWRKAAVVIWTRSFFKQFYGSVTKSDYVALRGGFIRVKSLTIMIINNINYCSDESVLFMALRKGRNVQRVREIEFGEMVLGTQRSSKRKGVLYCKKCDTD